MLNDIGNIYNKEGKITNIGNQLMIKEKGYIPNNYYAWFLFKFLKLFSKNNKLKGDVKCYKKIVLVKFGGIGDAILMTPILRYLKMTFINAKIEFVVWSSVSKLFEEYGVFSSGMLDATGIRQFLNAFSINESLRIAKYFKTADLSIFFNRPITTFGTLKLLLISIISRNAIKIGFDTKKRGIYFDIKIQDKGFYVKHEVEYIKDILKELGINVNTSDLCCDILNNKHEGNKVKDLLENNSLKKFIVIHMGSAIEGWRKYKRINIQIWKKFLKELLKIKDIKIVLVGTDVDYKINEMLISEFKSTKSSMMRIYNFAGYTNFIELKKLINKAKLFIGNDSGVAHIASCTNTPIITIFTFSDYIGYKPWAKESIIINNNKADCSPCLYEKLYNHCKIKKCADIDPYVILHNAKKILTKNKDIEINEY